MLRLDGKLGDMLSVRNRSRFLTALAFVLAWVAVPSAARADASEDVDSTSRTEQIETDVQVAADTVELLNAEELEELEARDEDPGPEIVGGALNNQELTYIVIALAAAVLVLVLK